MVHLHYNKELFHLPSVHSLYEEQQQQIWEITYYTLGFITHKKSEIKISSQFPSKIITTRYFIFQFS